MKTITFTAYNRPECTAQALQALYEALARAPFFDKLIISIDPGNNQVEGVCETFAQFFSDVGLIDCDMHVNKVLFDASGNALVSLQRAFDMLDSDFNLHLEDDAIISPDALHMVQWFYESWGGPLSDYTLMSLCNHRDFGKGQHPDLEDDQSYMVESAFITAPFAWCASRFQWPFIKTHWNRKELPPNGWDWSLSMAMSLECRKSLHPTLSRCRNIGIVGQNSNERIFKATQEGLKYSDGEYSGTYKIVGRIAPGPMVIENWAQTEFARMFPR